MTTMKCRVDGRIDWPGAGLNSSKSRAQSTAAGVGARAALLGAAGDDPATGRRAEMNWINKVLLLAGGLAVATTFLSYLIGLGWLSLIVALPTFVSVTVLVPFFLGVHERRLAAERRLREGKRRRIPRSHMSRPAPAVGIGSRAPVAECGGRALEALPAAPD